MLSKEDDRAGCLAVEVLPWLLVGWLVGWCYTGEKINGLLSNEGIVYVAVCRCR